MEPKPVILRLNAQVAITGLYNYLVDIGYPLTAKRYISDMQMFIHSLGTMPERNPLCRYILFRKENLHCAVFKRHWVIPYEIKENEVIIRNIIHTSRLKE